MITDNCAMKLGEPNPITPRVSECAARRCIYTSAAGIRTILFSTDGTTWNGSGDAHPDDRFSCYGQPRATTYSLTLVIREVDESTHAPRAQTLEVSTEAFASNVSPQCPAAFLKATGTALHR